MTNPAAAAKGGAASSGEEHHENEKDEAKPKNISVTIRFQSQQRAHGTEFHLIVAALSQEHSSEVLAFRVLEVAKLLLLLLFQKQNNAKTREHVLFIRE